MPTEIVMPQMGAEMEEGTLLKWRKQPGDAVAKGDIIADIETDKATVEMDSYESGTFLRAVVEEGTTVAVGEVIAYLGAAGEQVPEPPTTDASAGRSQPPTAADTATGQADAQGDTQAQQQERATVSAASASEPMHAARTTNATDTTDPARPERSDATDASPPSGSPVRAGADTASTSASTSTSAAAPSNPAPARAGQDDPPPAQTSGARTDGQRVRASPVARSMAEELEVDLSQVMGTGPAGRITRRDVEEYARSHASSQVQGEEGRAPAEPHPAPPPRPTAPQVQTAGRASAPPTAPAAVTAPAEAAAGDDATEPLTRMRQAIARRMAAAKREMPHYYVAVSVDMAEAMAMRAELNAQVGETEKISVSHMILKACALAIEQHPSFNATFTDVGITVHHQINIGLAVALEDGLVVPAVLDCRGKSIGAIARASRDVAERARGGKLRPAELTDGTFTVSNLGMYGVETLIAIIQPGQSAILGVGLVEERAAVREGQVVACQMMTIALSADHRVTDGAQGARFIAEIKSLLENPVRLVL